MKHFIDIVIPLASKVDVPEQPPVNVPSIPDVGSLGTVSELADELKKVSEDKISEITKNAEKIRDQREEQGEGDRWYEHNQLLPPKISEMKEFRIEILFAYNTDDGT